MKPTGRDGYGGYGNDLEELDASHEDEDLGTDPDDPVDPDAVYDALVDRKRET